MSTPRLKFDQGRSKLAVKLPGISQWLVVRGGTACWEKGDAEDLTDLPELIVLPALTDEERSNG